MKTPAWQRKEGKNPKGGLNAKGRASYNALGGNLKPPVKSGNNPRRASFLARMAGNAGAEYKDGKPTRLLLSLQAWGASSKEDAKAKSKKISETLKSKKEGYHKMPNGKMMKDSSMEHKMKHEMKETPKTKKKEVVLEMKAKKVAEKKMSKIMKEYKAGELNIGKSKKMVKSPKQAIAIGLSVSGLGKPQMPSPKQMPKAKVMSKMKSIKTKLSKMKIMS